MSFFESKPIITNVSWYGGGSRVVDLVSGFGFWFRQGNGLVKVRWVYVRDKSGTHRDEYLYSTNMSLTPEQIVSIYTSRWAIEVTFQECKEHLQLEKTRVWCKNSVLTLVPLIFGSYSLIVLLYHKNNEQLSDCRTMWWPKKANTTFSNMLLSIRFYLWKHHLFQNGPGTMRMLNNSNENDNLILQALCQAA
ncbi:MAG: transposase [Myxococcales bacterium]|nr:transposase [Myxococcales bacterium]USN51652.1 MAG: transposase [Myxococcales bacterium]